MDQKNKKKVFYFMNFLLLLLLILLMSANQLNIAKLSSKLGIKNDILPTIEKFFTQKNSSLPLTLQGKELTGDLAQDSVNLVISEGVPEIYGEELSISFSEVQKSINTMKQYDPTYGKNKITFEGENLKRYIEIGLKISCEYCCSATAIVRKDGSAACGCAHSIAMRGLAAYLIQNHGTEYSNDEILRELSRWKGVYFPKQMIKKMAEQLSGGSYTPDIASLVMGIDLPDYSGESKNAPLPSEIENLPGMVGGC